MKNQFGAAMFEVILGMLLLAFGMLGILGLQSRTVAISHQSYMRTQATALTSDILDRMRVDRANAKAQRWNTDFTDAASAITGTEIYKVDLADWKLAVEKQLPAGKASVQVDLTGLVTVFLQWRESNAPEGEENQQLKTITRI